MSQSPEQIRADIEATRAELAADVEDLNQKVNPARVVERKVDSAKQTVGGVKDKVMGTASSASGSVSGTAGSAADTVRQAPGTAKQKAAGNPLVAGAVAFGAGYLLSTLLPTASRERQIAGAVKEQAQALREPVKQQLTETAAELKQDLAPAAQEAAESVKQTAASAAQTVKQTAGDAGGTVAEQARQSGSTVSERAGESAGAGRGSAAQGQALQDEDEVLVVTDVPPYPAELPSTSAPTGPRTTGMPPV